MTARLTRSLPLSPFRLLPLAPLLLLACRAPAATGGSAVHGPDVRSVCEDEATALAADPHDLETAIVVLDARTGRILAMAGRRGRVNEPDLRPRRRITLAR